METIGKSQRWVPWLEGLLLAMLVGAVFIVGGETVRASYHGYLHTSVGESVLRNGLTPENPYHAGSALRYYTLYPALGPLIGRLGFGPIWGFALLNILAALLFAPAWDAFAKAAGLRFSARRFSFLAAVLGFNALGWMGWALSPPPAESHVPIFSFIAMTWAEQGWGWDARLQAFLPKFLNVSSFAFALPFALWAMAPAMLQGRDESTEMDQQAIPSARKAVIPLAISLALNPLAGGFAALCIGLWKFPQLLKGTISQRFAWPTVGLLASLLAVPFLLPLFQSAPAGESMTGTVRFQHNGVMNFLGPMALLLLPGLFGILNWKSIQRNRWMMALGLAIAVTVFTRLPWGNQYKFARIAGLLWALPVGLWAARLWQAKSQKRWLPVLVLALSLPSLIMICKTYSAWGANAGPSTLISAQSKLKLADKLQMNSFPQALQAAEREDQSNAVLWMHPRHPGTSAGNGVVQGNALAPLLSHSLFVDLPQIHNDRIPGLSDRLKLSAQFWEPQASADDSRSIEAICSLALLEARAVLSHRSFLVMTHTSAPWTIEALGNAEAKVLAEDNGFSLWSLQALTVLDEN